MTTAVKIKRRKKRVPKVQTSINTRVPYFKNKYPWEEWMDGSWWQIDKGKDFEKSTLDMLRHITLVGWRKGYRVNAYRLPGDRSIRFQFYTGFKRPLDKLEHGFQSNFYKRGTWPKKYYT